MFGATTSVGAGLLVSVAVIVFVVVAATAAPFGYALGLGARERDTTGHARRQPGDNRCTCDEGAPSCPNRFAL